MIILPFISINIQHSEADIMVFISLYHYAKNTPTALGFVQHLLMLSQQGLWKDSMLFHSTSQPHFDMIKCSRDMQCVNI